MAVGTLHESVTFKIAKIFQLLAALRNYPQAAQGN
jgi:hypothetical protein